jgi:hypothetical protein
MAGKSACNHGAPNVRGGQLLAARAEVDEQSPFDAVMGETAHEDYTAHQSQLYGEL